MLFADISGFSRLTERLAQQGSSPEAIGEILNMALGSLVDTISNAGGDVVTFAGDAVLALFPANAEGIAAAVHAISVATLRLAGVEPAVGSALRLRSGVAVGDIWEALVGGHDGEWHHLVAGRAVHLATEAAGTALEGELATTPEMAPRFGGRARVVDGRRATVDLRNAPPAALAIDPPPTEAPVASFVAPAVRDAIAGGHLDWIAELRRITVGFIRLDGFDRSMTLAELNRAVQATQRIVAGHGGRVMRVLYDDKGLVVVAGWAGLQSGREVALDAIRASFEVRDEVAETSIGLASGTAFVGHLGSTGRRDYTAIGHCVNRSARLMEMADDVVLCDGTLRKAADQHVAFVGRGVVPLKGFDEPVAFYQPLGLMHGGASGGRPLIARQEEHRLILESLRRLQVEGAPTVVTVEGEAGIGKTRLAEAALARAREIGLRTLVLTANQLSRSSPYSAWRPAFRSLMGLDSGADSAAVAAKARALIGRDRHQMIPILLSALGVDDTEPGSTGDADALRSVMAELFESLIGPGPTALVFEDAQWVDSASLLLAEHLYRSRSQTGILVMSRLGSEANSQEWKDFLAEARGPRITLDPLTDAEAVAVATHLLDVDFLPPPVADLIREKAGGHPLFTEELVQSLRDQGVLKPGGGDRQVQFSRRALRSFRVPTTLQETVADRLGQLRTSELLTLKVASVVGREFDTDAVTNVHPTSAERTQITAALRRLVALDLVRPLGDEFVFKHTILRDVAYSLIPDSQRTELHRRAAEWYERTSGDVFVLAEHWRNAQDRPRAFSALEAAGDASMGTGSFREAEDLFADAKTLAPDGLPALDHARILRKLAVAQRGLGSLEASHTSLISGLGCLRRRFPRGLSLYVAVVAQIAIQLLHRSWLAPFEARSPATRARSREAAEIYFALGTTTFANLDAVSLFYAGLCALNSAERATVSDVLALSHSFMMYVTGVVGLRGSSSRYHQRALAAAGSVGREAVRAEILYNRAGFLGTRGEWQEAAALNAEALSLYSQVADHRGIRTATSLGAYHAHLRGRMDEEERRYQDLRELADQFDDGLMRLFGTAWPAELALRRGENRLALAMTDALADTSAARGDRAAALKVHGVRALALLRSGDAAVGRSEAETALETIVGAQAFTAPYAYDGYLLAARFWVELAARDPSDQSAPLALHHISKALRRLRRGLAIAGPAHAWVAGHVEHVAGNPDKAVDSWSAGAAAARTLELPFEEALILLDAAEMMGEEDRERALSRARDLVTSTGSLHLRERAIRSLPPLP